MASSTRRIFSLPFTAPPARQCGCRISAWPGRPSVVMVGAASLFLPLPAELIEACLVDGFAAKGERVVEANRRAFAFGRAAVAAP